MWNNRFETLRSDHRGITQIHESFFLQSFTTSKANSQVDGRTAQICYGPLPGNTPKLGAGAFSLCFAAAAFLTFDFDYISSSLLRIVEHQRQSVQILVCLRLFLFLSPSLSFTIPIPILHLCFACTMERHRQRAWVYACLRHFPSSFHLPGRSMMLSPRDYS